MNNNQLENTQKQVKFKIQMTFYEVYVSPGSGGCWSDEEQH